MDMSARKRDAACVAREAILIRLIKQICPGDKLSLTRRPVDARHLLVEEDIHSMNYLPLFSLTYLTLF